MAGDWHVCRFCGETSFRAYDDMVRYGARHWAHKTCYLDRRGICGLRASQVEEMPCFALKERGLLDKAREIVSAGAAR